MLVRLCLVQDSTSLKKLLHRQGLSPWSVLSPNPLDHVLGVEEILLGAAGASLARLRNFKEAAFEGGAVNRVVKSGGHGSSSRGSSP